MDIPEDIRATARQVVDPFLRSKGKIDGFALDLAIAQALAGERDRCAQAARDYLANEYMPDFGSLPDDLAAAIRSVPASLEE